MKPSWLIEAEKHIGEKEVKGSTHNPFILKLWKLIKRGGIKDDETPWCFTGETEILTEQGFVRFDELQEQKIFQADSLGALSLTNPIRKIVKDYDGEVFHLNHRSIKLTCDVNHRWWGHWGKATEKPLTFKTLNEIQTDGLQVPKVFSKASGVDLTNDELTLLAAFISDGKYRYSNGKIEGTPWSIDFEVSKPRKIEILRKLSPDHEYIQSKTYGPLTKNPLTVFRFRFPEFILKVTSSYKTLAHGFINSLSREQAKHLIEAYANFDGTPYQGKITLFTSNLKVRDSLIVICTLAGYLPSVQFRQASKSSLSDNPSWTITMSRNKETRTIRPKHISSDRFLGKMYCVEVPEGRIVVRGQNGTPTVTGNCAAFVGGCLETVGIQSTRFESAKSYESYGIPLPSPTVGSIVTFTRDGGGHVAFVVGQDINGNLICLGGNQGDRVCLSAFARSRATSFRWPKGVNLPPTTILPIMDKTSMSKSEA